MREFGAFVFYGFFFISLVQLIGHFNYDNAPTSVSFKTNRAKVLKVNRNIINWLKWERQFLNNISIFQGFLIAVSGFACYLAVGAKHIQLGIQPSEQEEEQLLPTGCVSVVLSFVFLFDSILTVFLSMKE